MESLCVNSHWWLILIVTLCSKHYSCRKSVIHVLPRGYFPDLLCGTACPLRCECLTVVSRPLEHSWRHCWLYDTLYIDTNIFKLPDSAFAAFLRGSCVLQIALIITELKQSQKPYDAKHALRANISDMNCGCKVWQWCNVSKCIVPQKTCHFFNWL